MELIKSLKHGKGKQSKKKNEPRRVRKLSNQREIEKQCLLTLF